MEDDDIIKKYQDRLKSNVSMEDVEDYDPENFSREYQIFRNDSLSTGGNAYENACNSLGSIVTVRPKDKDYEKLNESIEATHLNITPEQAAGFASFITIITIFLGIMFSLLYLFLTKEFSFTVITIFSIFLLTGILLLKPLTNIPNYLANKWRLEAGNQMVLCVLYIVMYMRHTSNLEHGLKFAADHVGKPLALDLRKIFWDVETGKYSTIKESLDSYLVRWRGYNLEFVEAFHLIEGSLLEENEDRRVSLLEKALDVILDGMYEKMLHYAHELQNPISILNMLGVVLPVLGLVILPLVGSLVQGSGITKVIILFTLYNLLLPAVLYSFGTSILSKRPTGYSEVDILKDSEVDKYTNVVVDFFGKDIFIHPFWIGFIVFLAVSLVGMIPIFLMLSGSDFGFLGTYFVDMRDDAGRLCRFGNDCFGPFGPGSVILGLFLPLGLALGLATYYKIKSRSLIKVRDNIKSLEKEFSGSLFQLGNRIGDGIPAEIAFGDVATNMEGTPTGNFFSEVNDNIRRLGMSMNNAIFGERGAIRNFPSGLIETSMKVLIESSKKGPLIVAKSLVSISVYVNRIHQVNERLRDLLADTISSMKSQISFLSPIISGIVVGISTMIVTIIVQLVNTLNASQTDSSGVGNATGNLGTIAGIFNIPNIIPSYYLQLIIGFYLVEMVIILSLLSSRIENGYDKLNEQYDIGNNLFSSSVLYLILSLIVTFIFTFLVSSIVPK